MYTGPFDDNIYISPVAITSRELAVRKQLAVAGRNIGAVPESCVRVSRAPEHIFVGVLGTALFMLIRDKIPLSAFISYGSACGFYNTVLDNKENQDKPLSQRLTRGVITGAAAESIVRYSNEQGQIELACIGATSSVIGNGVSEFMRPAKMAF